MYKPTFPERARYAFDNTLSKGTIAMVGLLGVFSATLIVLVSLLIWSTNMIQGSSVEELGFFGLLWHTLIRAIDSGAIDGDSGSVPFVMLMAVVTLGGIFLVSILIGVLTSGIEGRLESLRKGRSRVIESGHVVILGWSSQIFTIVSELVLANANQRRSCIVIMADRDKVEMEDELRNQVGATGRTRIVCRSGNPIDLVDIEIVSLGTAKSIIILSPEDQADPDPSVIKTMLAITHNPKRRSEPYHMVAEIRSSKNIQVAKLVGQNEVELVSIDDLIARVVAQTCRQSGLSVVYTELLDFGGDEIYFHAEPALVGRTFGEALLAYEASAVMGLLHQGQIQLNPPMETRIEDNDQIIAISQDDDTIRLSGLADLGISASAFADSRPSTREPERTLILGWNKRVPTIIAELDSYVASGSEVMVVADVAAEEIASVPQIVRLANQCFACRQADTSDRRSLDQLAIESYDRVVIMCYADTLDVQQADARTLITLLHLRDIRQKCEGSFAIVSEMLDIRNRNLAEIAKADDFIVSDRLASLMLAQVAQNKQLNAVFADIFDPEGAEIYFKPAANYIRPGEAVNFYTVAEAACRRGEVALGYRIANCARDAGRSYGVALNPRKSECISFSDQDHIIVLAES